jgi:hypothetical protein
MRPADRKPKKQNAFPSVVWSWTALAQSIKLECLLVLDLHFITYRFIAHLSVSLLTRVWTDWMLPSIHLALTSGVGRQPVITGCRLSEKEIREFPIRLLRNSLTRVSSSWSPGTNVPYLGHTSIFRASGSEHHSKCTVLLIHSWLRERSLLLSRSIMALSGRNM